MTFNSFAFLVFLPLVFLVFAFSREGQRWKVLLAVSVAFYAAWGAPWLLVALGFVTLASWTVGRTITHLAPGRARLIALWLGIAANLGVLIAVRYVPAWLGHASGWVSVGVSYFVFQAISYLADVYLEVAEPEPHLGLFALSMAFFPKLLQGPIERSGNLLPQLKRPWRFEYDSVRTGLLLFGRGLLRKCVIADRVALFVDAVYGAPEAHSGATLLLATYAYAVQIYFDFSGYTDMALGTARLFGIRLTPNFDSPYAATSIADFWRRWHISFSRWILDYIFKPLQMSWRNAGNAGTAAALLVTFLVSGIWHGASSGYVAWGLLHGVFMASSVYWRPFQKRLHRALRIEGTRTLGLWQRAVTFHLVCLAWVFFRAPDVASGVNLLERMAGGGRPQLSAGTFDSLELMVLLGALPFSWLLDRALPASGDRGLLCWAPARRWTVYVALAYCCLLFSAPSQGFIYFGF